MSVKIAAYVARQVRTSQVATKTYIAGPMTGYPEYNHPAFHAKAAELRAAGYDVINPAEFDAEIGLDQPWDAYLRRDLVLVAKECNRIVCLPGWSNSKGATLEVYVGKKLGFEIVYPSGRTYRPVPSGQAALDAHRESVIERERTAASE